MVGGLPVGSVVLDASAKIVVDRLVCDVVGGDRFGQVLHCQTVGPIEYRVQSDLVVHGLGGCVHRPVSGDTDGGPLQPFEL